MYHIDFQEKKFLFNYTVFSEKGGGGAKNLDFFGPKWHSRKNLTYRKKN